MWQGMVKSLPHISVLGLAGGVTVSPFSIMQHGLTLGMGVPHHHIYISPWPRPSLGTCPVPSWKLLFSLPWFVLLWVLHWHSQCLWTLHGPVRMAGQWPALQSPLQERPFAKCLGLDTDFRAGAGGAPVDAAALGTWQRGRLTGMTFPWGWRGWLEGLVLSDSPEQVGPGQSVWNCWQGCHAEVTSSGRRMGMCAAGSLKG